MVHLWEQGLAGLLVSKGFINKLTGVKIYLHMLGWENNANSWHNSLPVLMLLSNLYYVTGYFVTGFAALSLPLLRALLALSYLDPGTLLHLLGE